MGVFESVLLIAGVTLLAPIILILCTRVKDEPPPSDSLTYKPGEASKANMGYLLASDDLTSGGTIWPGSPMMAGFYSRGKKTYTYAGSAIPDQKLTKAINDKFSGRFFRGAPLQVEYGRKAVLKYLTISRERAEAGEALGEVCAHCQTHYLPNVRKSKTNCDKCGAPMPTPLAFCSGIPVYDRADYDEIKAFFDSTYNGRLHG